MTDRQGFGPTHPTWRQQHALSSSSRDLKVNKRCWNECAEVHPTHNQHVQLQSRSLKQEQLPDLPCHLPHACTLIPKSKSFSTTLEQLPKRWTRRRALPGRAHSTIPRVMASACSAP
ncbi:hypothetical protein D6D06_09072 [Aureobasidium pullulans]|nr:hypothetical protein D6D06_09072 [Aureobasidium pullulans]THX76701.1 hypothetical protein D6D05_06008 [Aureobasidium pullulans]TIA09499.1 hypothetical protein D6C80_08566 [Aureobasidium pullulans]